MRLAYWILCLSTALPATEVLAPRAAPPVASSSVQAEAALQAGQRRLQAGDPEGAERLWRASLQQAGDSGLLYALGALLFEQTRLAEAEALFQELARRSPELADAWYQLGLVRAARGHYRDAADAQRLAVAHSPAFGQAYCALALDLRESGQTPEGMLAVREALRLLPHYAGAWNLLGNLQQDLGRFDEAMQSYRQALSLEPRYPGAWFNLGALLEKRERYDDALRAYGRAIQDRPDFAEALLARAELALELKRLKEAAADFQRVSRLDGWKAEAYWGLSRVAKARNRQAEAERYLADYRRSVRVRDHFMAKEAAAGREKPSPYEPGLPLAQSAPIDPGAQP